MTYPNQQPAYPPPPQQQPQPGYLPSQTPPQQYPPAQGYPPPPHGYVAQGYPQQGYAPPQQYAPPPVQHLNASIDDFYDQPAASGKSIASWFQTPGQTLTGVVARAISKADLRPQTDMQTKQPKHFSDGRPMITMTIPLLVQPQRDFPDGRAAWIISSSDREDLDFAMQAAGCAPRTVPEAGATISITFVGFKQIPGFGAPKKVKQITYTRPAGAPAAPPTPQAQAAQPTPPAGYPTDANGQYDPQAPPFNATAPAPSAAPATWAAPATAAGYAEPNGQAAANEWSRGVERFGGPNGEAAQDMVTGNQNVPPNGNVPNGQYNPAAMYLTPTGMQGPIPPPGQQPYVATAPPQQMTPPVEYAAQAQQAAMQGLQNYGGPPQAQAAPPAPPGPPAQPAQQWAAPSDLTAEQQERLRQLTGN
jgi:hypothetical protein